MPIMTYTPVFSYTLLISPTIIAQKRNLRQAPQRKETKYTLQLIQGCIIINLWQRDKFSKYTQIFTI